MTAESFSSVTEPSHEGVKLRIVSDEIRTELSRQAMPSLLEMEWGPARHRLDDQQADALLTPEDN